MALPLRPQTVPQCTACLRSYAFARQTDAAATGTALRQQIRGKKKMVNTSATVPVRLLKNVKTFGKKGSIVPISRGQMRNYWFPQRIVEYVTTPELKTLRLNNVAMERNFDYGLTELARAQSATSAAMAPWQKAIPGDIRSMSNAELKSASASQKAPEVKKLTPERSAELVDIFTPPRLEFYRQPIIEAKEPEAPPAEPKKAPRFGSGAAADLLAARTRGSESEKPTHTLQAIYGSVSTQDVLVALRAAMGHNDEAARVVLHEQDVQLVDLPETEGSEAGKVKHIGDFVVEIKVKGSETAVRRTVRVIPQEL